MTIYIVHGSLFLHLTFFSLIVHHDPRTTLVIFVRKKVKIKISFCRYHVVVQCELPCYLLFVKNYLFLLFISFSFQRLRENYQKYFKVCTVLVIVSSCPVSLGKSMLTLYTKLQYYYQNHCTRDCHEQVKLTFGLGLSKYYTLQ